jgi:hypothetical protein
MFVGWDTNDDGIANHFQIAGKVTIGANVYAEDLNLKAVWSRTPYTLSFNTAGGNDIDPKTFYYGVTLDGSYLPTPTKAGETFIGWYEENGTRWGLGNNTGPNRNLHLIARDRKSVV